MRYTWKYIVVIAASKAGALPVAVPGICLRRLRSLASADRCHSLGSLDSATGGGRLAPPKQARFLISLLLEEKVPQRGG